MLAYQLRFFGTYVFWGGKNKLKEVIGIADVGDRWLAEVFEVTKRVLTAELTICFCPEKHEYSKEEASQMWKAILAISYL